MIMCPKCKIFNDIENIYCSKCGQKIENLIIKNECPFCKSPSTQCTSPLVGATTAVKLETDGKVLMIYSAQIRYYFIKNLSKESFVEIARDYLGCEVGLLKLEYERLVQESFKSHRPFNLCNFVDWYIVLYEPQVILGSGVLIIEPPFTGPPYKVYKYRGTSKSPEIVPTRDEELVHDYSDLYLEQLLEMMDFILWDGADTSVDIWIKEFLLNSNRYH